MLSVLKYELIEKIVQANDVKLLQQIKHLLEKGETNSWKNLDPALKSSIKKGLAQADKGEVIPHEIVMAYFKNRYFKK